MLKRIELLFDGDTYTLVTQDEVMQFERDYSFSLPHRLEKNILSALGAPGGEYTDEESEV